jgi:predicted amidophosphoribosyltransferase
MGTCPRCKAKNRDISGFCKNCGYIFSGPTFGLLQYVPRQSGYREIPERTPAAELMRSQAPRRQRRFTNSEAFHTEIERR